MAYENYLECATDTVGVKFFKLPEKFKRLMFHHFWNKPTVQELKYEPVYYHNAGDNLFRDYAKTTNRKRKGTSHKDGDKSKDR